MNARTHPTNARRRWIALVLALIIALTLMPRALLARDDGGNHAAGIELWVNGQDTDRIFVLDGEQLIDTIMLPAGSGPHMTMFSPDGSHAYVAANTSGDVIVLDAETRQIITSLDFGASGVHQAIPSPDGTSIFVAQQATKELIRLAANETAQVWSETGRLTLAATPVCTVAIPGTNKAYVSLAPEDLAIVDLATMTRTGTVDLNGQMRCNYAWSKNGTTLYLTSENGTDSFLYTLDPATDTLSLLHTFTGVKDLHSVEHNPNGKSLSIIGRGNDLFYTVNLADLSITSFELGSPDVADQPDGLVVNGNNAFVNLKATGKLAFVKRNQGTATYLDLVAPSRNALTNIVRRPAGPGTGDCRVFAETRQSVCGRFLDYWEANGGLMIFGFPISGALADEQGQVVQFFERARFEYHPANGAPYDVLLGRLGAELLDLAGE